MISIFNEYELELLISGLPDIDPKDWQVNTKYSGGYSPNTPVIQWFWDLVTNELSPKERAMLLQFGNSIPKIQLILHSYWYIESACRRFQESERASWT